jgi:hypothetical protein
MTYETLKLALDAINAGFPNIAAEFLKEGIAHEEKRQQDLEEEIERQLNNTMNGVNGCK